MKTTEYYKLRYNSNDNINSLVLSFNTNMNNIWKDDAIDIITTLNQNNIYCHNVLNYAQREMAELTTILDNSKKTTFRIYNLMNG